MQNTHGQIHQFKSCDNFFRRNEEYVLAGRFDAHGRQTVARGHPIGDGSVFAASGLAREGAQ